MNPIADRRLLLQRHNRPWADATVMLGGGGARGLAHLGALRALGHSGIGVQRLVGVSMGALMAAMCAAERDVERVEMLAREFLESDRYRNLQQRVMGKAAGAPRGSSNKSWTRRFRNLLITTRAFGRAVASESLMPSAILEEIVDALLPDIQIEDLRKPLFLITVDLRTGERVTLSRGSLRQAVLASMSIPGVFPAIEIDGRRLSDVGVYDAVPCDVARQLMRSDASERPAIDDSSEPGELIVVDVSLTPSNDVACESALQSMLRVQELAEIRIREQQLALADIVVRPRVGDVPWYDFTKPEPLIRAGYEAVQRALNQQESEPGSRAADIESRADRFIRAER